MKKKFRVVKMQIMRKKEVLALQLRETDDDGVLMHW
jgi:hypothetical protein